MRPDQDRDDDFEGALKQDLPRGLEKQARMIGRDRGLSARWLAADELVPDEWPEKGGLLLGTRGGRVIGWKDDRHLLTIAGSRAGKGVSLIIPNLISYEGSAVIIDPKGENAARTAGRRGNGTTAGGPGLKQDVYVLDPFGESGRPTASFNPLGALDAGSADVVEDIGLFADALVMHPEHGERHWTESAQALIRALILLVVADPRFKDRRNLVTVRRVLTLTDPAIADAQDAVPEDMDPLTAQQALIKMLLDQTETRYGHICIGVGEQLMAMGDNERGSVLSSARTQTQWLDSPKMPAVLERSDFDLGDLKRKRMSVYLCLPATRMATHARWLRLMVLLALGVMERVKHKPELPVLFVLDEFPVLGYMQSIETAAGLMAGFGVKLWPIVQNVGQLKQHYSKSWETFFANSGIVTAFGVSDSETLKVLSECLGRTGIVVKVDSGASRNALSQGASPFHDDRREVPLLAEHELRMAFGRSKNRALIYNVEKEPAVVERFCYFKDEKFKGLYDPDPNYGPAL
jgi:type IV secretion system protein VirD4